MTSGQFLAKANIAEIRREIISSDHRQQKILSGLQRPGKDAISLMFGIHRSLLMCQNQNPLNEGGDLCSMFSNLHDEEQAKIFLLVLPA